MPANQSSPTPRSSRLASLDALRGFDMFFISGGAVLIAGICKALGYGESLLARNMDHALWAGFMHHDTIFPLFLFLAGVSWPFSLASQRARGRTPLQIHLKLLGRVASLFLIGLSFGGILNWSPTFRLSSVLGFIGISWGISALVFCHVEKLWQRLAIFVAITAGYFALLHFFAASGAPAGADTYSKEWNVIAGLDRAIWPNHLFRVGVYDPESLLTIPGGVLIAMMGMGAGELLRSDCRAMRKVLALAAAAAVTLAVDLVFVHVVKVPIVKALWTVSFVFAAATYSLLMLALFYLVVDVLGFKKWTVLFDPIGKNSILVYTLTMIGVTGVLRSFLFKGTIKHCGDWGSAVYGLATFAILWLIARFCQRHNIFLKV